MELDHAELAEALALCAMVVPTKTTRPILEYVRMQTDGDAVEIYATDLELTMRVRVTRADADANTACDVLLPLRRAHALVRTLDDEKVSVSAQDEPGPKDVRFAAGGSRFTLRSPYPTDDFPDCRHASFSDDAKVAWLDAPSLVAGIHSVAFAASADEAATAARHAGRTRCVRLDTEGRRLKLVATDGVRIALRDLALADDFPGGNSLPLRAIKILANLASDADRIGFAFDESTTVATVGARATLVALAWKDLFPPYAKTLQRVTPPGAVVDVPRAPWLAALRRAELILGELTKSCCLELSTGRLTVSVKCVEVGDGSFEVPVAHAGPSAEVSAQARFLIQALEAIDVDTVQLSMPAAGQPIKLSTTNDWTCYVMPTNIN